MKKFVDIISIAVVSLLLMFVLKKAIQFGSAKPEPPAEEEVAEQAPQQSEPQEPREHLETKSFDKPEIGGGGKI